MFQNRLSYAQLAGIAYDKPDDSGGGKSYDDVADLISELGKKIENSMPDEAIESLKSLAKRNNGGSLDPVHKVLFNDNKQLRDDKRELENKVLGDNQVAIDSDKAELISVLEENELTSKDEVKKFIEESQEAITERAELKKKQKLNDVEKIYGAKSTVLEKLLDDDLDLQKAEVEDEDEGKKEIVNVVDSEGNKTEFSKFVDEELSDFKPSIFGEEGTGNTGRKWANQQTKSNGKPKGSKAQEFIEKQNKQAKSGNPLKPASNEDES